MYICSSANQFGPYEANGGDVRSALLNSEGVSPQNTSETNIAPVCHISNYCFLCKVSI